jgi:hypothetical protein
VTLLLFLITRVRVGYGLMVFSAVLATQSPSPHLRGMIVQVSARGNDRLVLSD